MKTWSLVLLFCVSQVFAQDFEAALQSKTFFVIQDNMKPRYNILNGRVVFNKGQVEMFNAQNEVKAQYTLEYNLDQGFLRFTDKYAIVSASADLGSAFFEDSLKVISSNKEYVEFQGDYMAFGKLSCEARPGLIKEVVADNFLCPQLGFDATWLISYYNGRYYFDTFWTNNDGSIRIFRSVTQ